MSAMNKVTEGGTTIIGSAAIGWLAGLLLPIFFQNSTGAIQNATLQSLNNNGTIPLVLTAVGLLVGVLIVMSAASRKK